MIWFKKKNIFKNIKGEIAYYDLQDWWMTEFTEEERDLIRSQYKPYGVSAEYSIDKGNIDFSSSSKLHFLSYLPSWFSTEEQFHIAEKIMKKVETYILDSNEIITIHLYYGMCVKNYYPHRDTMPGALDKAIEYCKRQIQISEQAREAFLKDSDFLPSHTGFKQLAIIYEKQGKISEALDIAKMDMKQGWNGDAERRVARLEKKCISKRTRKDNS